MAINSNQIAYNVQQRWLDVSRVINDSSGIGSWLWWFTSSFCIHPITSLNSIQKLTDEQLQQFQKDGQMEVMGHLLKAEDVRIFYNFTGDKAAELSEQYIAESEGDVSHCAHCIHPPFQLTNLFQENICQIKETKSTTASSHSFVCAKIRTQSCHVHCQFSVLINQLRIRW